MSKNRLAAVMWGDRSRLSYLLFAACILLFAFLGARDIWTQEHRWADIVSGMFYRHDFLHPYLGEHTYYDKPLLSYWMMAFVAWVQGELTIWSLRLPSALAGLLSIVAIYRLGSVLKNKSLGLLSGWLLATTFYFLFWARTSSADMLNMAGSLLAITWYMEKRERATAWDYAVFYVIVALTCLCKGLVGAIVPVLAVLTDITLQKTWRQHMRPAIFFAALPALVIYVLPFLASSLIGGESYTQNGLYLVYRENILRYFQPFDHQGPIYTYFLYLPIYLMPWAIFFIPALFTLPSRWRRLTLNAKWVAWTLAVLFMFFTVSGSRRSYYVLPMVPIAILFTADWVLEGAATLRKQAWAANLIVIFGVLLFFAVNLLPAWYYARAGVSQFAAQLKQVASEQQPWSNWQVVMLDAESKLNFYLQLPPQTKNLGIAGSRDAQTTESLLRVWPMLQDKPAQTIFITRQLYVPLLQPYFKGYREVVLSSYPELPFKIEDSKNRPVAFVPMAGAN